MDPFDPQMRKFLNIFSKWCVAESRLVMEFSGRGIEFSKSYRNANKPPRGWNFENRLKLRFDRIKSIHVAVCIRVITICLLLGSWCKLKTFLG